MLGYIVLFVVILIVLELVFYIFFVPTQEHPALKHRAIDEALGNLLCKFAYILGILRIPLTIVPYLVKLAIYFGLGNKYRTGQGANRREALNITGDLLNLTSSATAMLLIVNDPLASPMILLLFLPLWAEFIRLLTERGQMIFSALWQLMPHRAIADAIDAHRTNNYIGRLVCTAFGRYSSYYGLDDAARAEYALDLLKHLARFDPDMSQRLEYVTAFRIVSDTVAIRTGKVRDVSRGEVFIHHRWTNDPWLLMGQAMRRGSWLFDPRYLQRPFYHRTEANGVMTSFVLNHLRYCLPYALFQFGHEVKVARFDLFFRLMRRFGKNLEELVRADGTYRFDPLIDWIEATLHQKPVRRPSRPLWTDDEVIEDLRRQDAERVTVSPTSVATGYTYPQQYVDQVLWPKIIRALGNEDATKTGPMDPTPPNL